MANTSFASVVASVVAVQRVLVRRRLGVDAVVVLG
jgi:hypothetical protein